MRLATEKELKNLRLIAYGRETYEAERFRPVKNNPYWIKPSSGGLWTSPADSKWGWKDWCKSEDFYTGDMGKSFTIKLAPTSKVVVIDCFEDLEDLPVIESDRKYSMFGGGIDFELMASTTDAIWLTERGQRETHLSLFKKAKPGKVKSLYGWDCETVLILNKDCIIPTN